MLRFILDVLLLRKLIESRGARVAFFVFLLGALFAGFIYAFVVFKAVSERSQHPHVHAHSTH
jgi:hypothetical protein